jgi:hypothetical protein
MQAVIYHEVLPESLDTVLQEGIKRSDQGEKSDSVVQRTDECLEQRLPDDLRDRGLSRRHVVYGFLSSGNKLVDIRDGQEVEVGQFSSQREQVLLRITVDSANCFASDLDAYDAVKMCVASDADDVLLTRLAERYWAHVIPLDEYEAGRYRRPEVMVTSDVDANQIAVVTPDA